MKKTITLVLSIFIYSIFNFSNATQSIEFNTHDIIEETGIINGTVTELLNPGTPIENALISLASVSGGASYYFSSNASGYYEGEVEEGTYNYIVSADGYISESLEGVNISPNNTINNSFELDEFPYPSGSVEAAEISSSQVQISWGEDPNNSRWLFYDDGSDNNDNYGSSSDYSIEYCLKFPSSELTELTGCSISKIAFWKNDLYTATNYIVKIYQGDAGTSEIYSEDITSQVVDGWAEYNLENRASFDNTQTLWIAIYSDAIGGQKVSPAASAISGITDGDYYSYNGGDWQQLADLGYHDLSWMLRCFATDASGKSVIIGKPKYIEHKDYSWSSGVLVPSGASNIPSAYPNSAQKGAKEIQGYNIYRTNCYDTDPTDFLTYTTETEYIDNDWGTLAWGVYKWAVEAVYTNNNSVIIYSSCIDKDMITSVNIAVTTNSGDSPEETQIVFTNTNEPTNPSLVYQLDLGVTGNASWSDFRKGTYNISIIKNGFAPITVDDILIDAPSHFNYELEEIIITPAQLYVSPTGNATWSKVDFIPFFDNFDSEDTFNLWEIIVGGSSDDTWFWITDFDGNSVDGTPFAFVNSDATGAGNNMDELFISPIINAFNVNELIIEFDQVYNNLSSSEKADIEVYDGSQWVTVLHQATDVGTWSAPEHIVIDVSEYANAEFRVRFHYLAPGWDWYWAIDNVSIHNNSGKYSNGKELQSYKIWHNNEYIINTDTSYYEFGSNTEILVSGETYLAEVASVYSTGISEKTSYEWTYLPCDYFSGFNNIDASIIDEDDVLLTWSYINETDFPTIGTNIYRNGEFIAFVDELNTSYTDLVLIPNYYDYCLVKVFSEDNGHHSWTSCIGEDCIEDVLVNEDCLPPVGLTAEYITGSGYTAILNWGPPVFPASEWLEYGDGDLTFQGIGAESSDYNMKWACKFVPEDLTAYAYGYVTKVAVYQGATVGDYLTEVRILSGEDGNTVLYAQDVTGTLVEGWNEIDLTSAVEFDNTENLWISMYVERPGGTYNEPVCNTFTDIPDRSDYFSYNGNPWVTILEMYGEEEQTWMLKGFVSTSPNGKSVALNHVDLSNGKYTNYTVSTTTGKGLIKADQSTENIVFHPKGAKDFLGYNIYRNGEQINQDMITELTYLDYLGDMEDYCYEITAVHSLCGESVPTNESCLVAAANVAINPNSQTVNTSQVFTTSIEITGVQNLGGFEFSISFDPQLLQANFLNLGDFLGSTGRQVFPLHNNIDNTSGVVEFAIVTLGPNPPGPNGDGVLLNIEWTSAANINTESISDLLIQNLQIAEPSGTLIPTSFQNGVVTIAQCYIHDFDCDCDVDIVDVTMAAFAYGTSTGEPNYDPAFDLDTDGDIDIVDITMVTYDYGWTCSKKEAIAKLEGVNNENVQLVLSVNNPETIDNGIFEMELLVENIQQLGGYEFEFDFDQQTIEILSVEHGDFLESTNREIFPLQNNIDAKQGKVHISMATLGANIAGASGQGRMIKLRCKALNTAFEFPTLAKAQLVRIDAEKIDYTLKNTEIEFVNNGETSIITTYPSPFKDEMTIHYKVGQAGNLSFKVFNIFGKLLKQTEQIYTKPGEYNKVFKREALIEGIYIYSLVYEGKILSSKRVTVLK